MGHIFFGFAIPVIVVVIWLFINRKEPSLEEHINTLIKKEKKKIPKYQKKALRNRSKKMKSLDQFFRYEALPKLANNNAKGETSVTAYSSDRFSEELIHEYCKENKLVNVKVKATEHWNVYQIKGNLLKSDKEN